MYVSIRSVRKLPITMYAYFCILDADKREEENDTNNFQRWH